MSKATSEGWFDSYLGRWLLEEESVRCSQLLPAGYYPTALQVGMPQRDYLADIETGSRFLALPAFANDRGTDATAVPTAASSIGENDQQQVTEPDNPVVHPVVARPGALPFSDRTHSLVVLPHVLDFSDDPHAVLREVNQVLSPEGCVVITGFNQLSMWGLSRMRPGKSPDAPWSGRHYRAGRVQDWLSLLGIDIVGGCNFCYQPPLQNARWHDKLAFVERLGDRWWPGLGAVYMIVGKKREIASSHNGNRQAWRRFIPAIARPAVSSAGIRSVASGRNHLRLVVKNSR